MAAVSLGAVPFSIYQTSSPEQIQYVVSDAGAKVAIVETAFLDVFNKAREELPEIETLIVIDGEGGDHTLDRARGSSTPTSTPPSRSRRSSPTTC